MVPKSGGGSAFDLKILLIPNTAVVFVLKKKKNEKKPFFFFFFRLCQLVVLRGVVGTYWLANDTF